MAQGGIVSFQGGGDPYFEKYQQYLRVLQDPSQDPAANSSAFQRMLPNATAAEQYDTARQIEAARMQSLPGPGFFTATTPQERAAYETRDKLIRQFSQGKFDPRVQPAVQPTGKTDIVAPDVVTPVVEAPVSGAGGAGDVPPPARNIPTAPAMPSVGGLGDMYTPPQDFYSDMVIPEEKVAEEEATRLMNAFGTDPNRAKMQERLAAMEGRATKEEERAPWMALAEAGLGMAAGNSPFALQNIAAGGMQGIKSLQAAKTRAVEAEEKRYELASKLADKEREEQLIATKFGFDSQQHSEARADRIKTAKAEGQQRLASDAAKNNFEVKKFKVETKLNERKIAVDLANAERQAQAIEKRADKDAEIARLSALKTESKTVIDQLKELNSNQDLSPNDKIEEYNRLNILLDSIRNALSGIPEYTPAQAAMLNKYPPRQ
jgi:hypothetical protein